MPLHPVHISKADADSARYEMFGSPDLIVQRRMLCLRMKSLGFAHHDIADVIGCSRNTIGNYVTLYEQSGIEGIRQLKHHRPESELDGHKTLVAASLREHPPRSVKEAAQRIEDLTGVKRSLGRVRCYLHRLGMKPLRTGQVPAKADALKQRHYHDETIQPLLQKAKQGQCHVLFMDSAHFVLSAFVAFVWCFERIFVKTAPGRFRLNVIGALNATTHELTALYNTTYITAQTVVAMLEKVGKRYAGLPIHIFLDNARYQHCALVLEAAQRLNITLEFLPPYSPNLNLIERLWKLVKAKVLAARYFPDAKSFQKAILDFLAQVHTQKEMKSLMTLNFQLYPHAQFPTA